MDEWAIQIHYNKNHSLTVYVLLKYNGRIWNWTSITYQMLCQFVKYSFKEIMNTFSMSLLGVSFSQKTSSFNFRRAKNPIKGLNSWSLRITIICIVPDTALYNEPKGALGADKYMVPLSRAVVEAVHC